MARNFASWKTEIRATVRLALPVILVQVGLMAMGTVDSVMVGHVSAAALAAVALGNLYFVTVTVFGMGALMALDPIVSQAVAAGDDVAVSRGMQRGMLLAIAITVPASLMLLPGQPVLAALRQPADVVPTASTYAHVSIPGILPFFAFVVLRQSLQAMGRVMPIVMTVLLANIVNVVLNWMLIYGNLGMPTLGAVGSGWASSISRWFMAIALLLIAWRSLSPHLLPLRRDVLALVPLLRMLRVGVPIGVQIQLEFGAFGVIALLMGVFGTVQMAGHQVAISLASLTFMVPLGISAAAAVRVGYAVGLEDPLRARRSAGAALLCGFAFMAASATTLLIFPHHFARFYTIDARVIQLAAILIPIAGVFQVFDGLQVVSVGILRGLGDTRTPMLVSVLGFWLVGMPVSLYLGFRSGGGPVGLWWGLVVGLFAVSCVLLLRVRRQLNRGLRRLVIDDDAVRMDPAAASERVQIS